ncbi:MAG: hypothetical protein QOE28_1175 [Solirubrobacteraceae bacterium]|jgi:hypothetical protein|nr:hypothetical protein [Solirubrobacteraceae bacterium]
MLCALSLAAAGCGSEPLASQPAPLPTPRGDFGPSQPGTGTPPRPVAPKLQTPDGATAASLAGGSVGVVGVEGAVGVRPATLDVASDGRLTALRWTRWDARIAEGTGTLRLIDCDPNCAGGTIRTVAATVRLSSPRLCGRATYFDRAEVGVTGGESPASYVRAPC